MQQRRHQKGRSHQRGPRLGTLVLVPQAPLRADHAFLVELPRLVGLSLAEAQKQLTEAGLVLGTMSGRTSSRVRSVNQDGVTLTAGSVVAKGSAVNLVFP